MSLPEVANLVETCGCFGLVWQASALRFSFGGSPRGIHGLAWFGLCKL